MKFSESSLGLGVCQVRMIGPRPLALPDRPAWSGAAQQPHNVAEILRKQHDPKFDAYVKHTRYHSMVFVGDYADRDDSQ